MNRINARFIPYRNCIVYTCLFCGGVSESYEDVEPLPYEFRCPKCTAPLKMDWDYHQCEYFVEEGL